MDPTEDVDFFVPATRWHVLGEDIYWRPYQHYGTRCYAGEGLLHKKGDTSGCVTATLNGIPLTNAPLIVEARLYRKEGHDISALLSYPNGIAPCDQYFWEVYDLTLLNERMEFTTEEDMEQHIMSLMRQNAQ